MKRTFNLPTVILAITCLLMAGAPLMAQGIGKGNGNGGGGGGGGGGSTPDIQIVQLETADGVGTHDEAYDVNDLREVVGRATLPTGELSAAYWTVDETSGVVESTLSLLDGGHAALGINNQGEIVGQTHDAAGHPVGVYWATPTSTAIVLQLPVGFDVSLPKSINDGGIICGLVAVDGDSQSSVPVLWQVTDADGGRAVSPPIVLPAFEPGASAQDINNSDSSGVAQVVGMQRTTWTPLLWEVQTLPDGTLVIPANPQVLDHDAGAFATGVNNNGDVCGRTDIDAVVWTNGTESILDRPGKGRRQVPRCWAWAIGDSGIIVGEAGSLIDPRACFWDGIDGSMTYLDDYLDADSPLLGLGSASAVNAIGDIVGRGWNGAFIAIPR